VFRVFATPQNLDRVGARLPQAINSRCLACGRVATEAERQVLCKSFEEEGWELWDEAWLFGRLFHGKTLCSASQGEDRLILRCRNSGLPLNGFARG
jgi:hypothetical protein